MAVSPEIETERPNTSPRSASEAVSLACCVQTPAVLVNIYAEPELVAVSSSRKAPTMAVSPEIETEKPKLSTAKASEANSFVSSVTANDILVTKASLPPKFGAPKSPWVFPAR